MSDVKPDQNVTPDKDLATPDNIRDYLAERLLRMVRDGVKVKVTDADGVSTIEYIDPPASYIAAINQYLKINPPATLPAAGSATGVLKKHLGAVLPFAGKTGTKE